MASITITLHKTDHVSIEQNETGGTTITFPRIETVNDDVIDDAICIHNGPLVHIMECENGLEIFVEN